MSISFKPNIEKIRHAVLYCIEQNGGAINVYNLQKIIFEADKYHLNKYGRPVTGDTYIAMKHGTVPSKTYDLSKKMRSENHFIFSDEKPDMRKLSKSDVEALLHGFKQYAGLTFTEVQEKNHSEVAWKNTETNKQIPFELMVENDAIREYLKENGSGISV